MGHVYGLSTIKLDAKSVYEAFPWIMMGVVFGGASLLFNAYCQLTLNVGLLPVWTFLLIASIVFFVKGYSHLLPPVDNR